LAKTGIEAFVFAFGPKGDYFRGLVAEQITSGVDAVMMARQSFSFGTRGFSHKI